MYASQKEIVDMNVKCPFVYAEGQFDDTFEYEDAFYSIWNPSDPEEDTRG